MSEKLEELEDKLFMLKMKDTWDINDYRYEDELIQEIRKLKGEK